MRPSLPSLGFAEPLPADPGRDPRLSTTSGARSCTPRFQASQSPPGRRLCRCKPPCTAAEPSQAPTLRPGSPILQRKPGRLKRPASPAPLSSPTRLSLVELQPLCSMPSCPRRCAGSPASSGSSDNIHPRPLRPRILFWSSGLVAAGHPMLLFALAIASPPPRATSLRLSASSDGLPMPRSPEEWRSFRAALVAKQASLEDGEPAAVACAANAARLRLESPDLWGEYVASAWAHEIPAAEAGGLLCAMPLQGILLEQANAGSQDPWPRALRRLLHVEGGEPGLLGGGLSPAGASGEDGAVGSRLLAGFGAGWRAATLLCNHAFTRLDRDALAGERGELWRMQQRALSLRGQVRLCLQPPGPGCEGGISLLLNKPLKWSQAHAQLVASSEAGSGDSGRADGLAPAAASPPGHPAPTAADVLRAFGSRPVLYRGGPDQRHRPARCLHGLGTSAVPGSVELVAGTRVFTASGAAATAAVLAGRASADDFRIFIGECRDLDSRAAEWRAVACCRSIVLKQCRSLPRALWHEVLDLCGGSCAEMSAAVDAENGNRAP